MFTIVESSMARFVSEEDYSSCIAENELELGKTEAERELLYVIEEVMRT